jgi:site-specific recombinase XerD
VHTRQAYEQDIKQWFDFLAALGVDVLAANSDHVTAYMRVCEQSTSEDTGQLITPATVARRVSVVSSFYRHARRRHAITENPVQDVDRPKIDPDHSDTVGLTLDESRRLVETAALCARDAHDRYTTAKAAGRAHVRLRTAWLGAERDHAIIALMLSAGGRETEMARETCIEDLGYDRGHRVLFVTRKGGKRQSLALGASARVVDRYLTVIREETGRTSGPLFLTHRGQPPDRAWIFRMVRSLAVQAHIPSAAQLSPHSLRHTFATTALDLGSTLDELQDAMGHADPRTTRRYDRARNRIDRSPAHRVSRALLGEDQ